MKKAKYILPFDSFGLDDIALVGGKNASLGEMIRDLKKEKIPVPMGFAITALGYQHLLEGNNLKEKLQKTLHGIDPLDTKVLQSASIKAKELIMSTQIPNDLQEEIIKAYKDLSLLYKEQEIDVAVRSSATAEDLPTASFAGQQETFLNIKGKEKLLQACKQCFASLFTPRAIAYRHENKIDHFSTYLSIGVQKMVRSDLSSSGVIFTLDTETGFAGSIFITSSYGLGETIVQGSVDPDEFFVSTPLLKKGFSSLFNKVLGKKEHKLIYGKEEEPLLLVETSEEERSRFSLSDEEVLTLARISTVLEAHYSKKHKRWTPLDIEWAKDGITNELFIVQARPETVQSRKNMQLIQTFSLEKEGEVLAKGKSVGTKICHGIARVIHDIKDMHAFKKGEILITEMTNPDWVPIMRIAAGIVTNRGGRTSHAAIVSRELGLPCIVGTSSGTETIHTGDLITLDCTQGEKGIVYKDHLPFKISTIDVSSIKKPKTKILMNLGYPDDAFALSLMPCDGVGLAREEFIISEYIRIHPLALIHPEKITDEKVCAEIEKITKGYKDKKQYFIDKLASGIGTIAAAFYPREVILRFSDFKTNEYSNLIGGAYFEPKEENPMIGWRGASRYYSDGYRQGFALECAAVKKVREIWGLTNLKVMIPVCRTIAEAKKVLSTMKSFGLQRKKKSLEIYMMCEVPSNVILMEEFCKLFDGFSIGSNDLTQLTLAVDRDSHLVEDIYDERNEAVTKMIEIAIKTAKRNKKKIGICGEAPSTYKEFAEFLIRCGIDSISSAPSSLLKTLTIASNYEKRKRAR